MRRLRVWLPEFYTEAHRTDYYQSLFVAALYKYGIDCVRQYDDACDLVFCGSFFHFDKVRDVRGEKIDYRDARRPLGKRALKRRIPIVHYNWDMYPFNIDTPPGENYYGDRWKQYIDELKSHCDLILVPSRCTIDRTHQYVGSHVPVEVVRSSVRPFSQEVWAGDFVLDAMRNYPDPNKGAVERACQELGIPYVFTNNTTPWEEYKRLVAGCRFIASAQYEASTGGLSALEAYYLGKPVLLSNSPRHGGRDYFGPRAAYFQWDKFEELKDEIQRLWEYTKKPRTDPVEQAHWIATEYSEDRMAMELSRSFRRLLGHEERTFTPENHVHPYYRIDRIDNEYGYIVWRVGTGDNIEILHISACIEGKGYGRELVRCMCERLKETKSEPYFSVFGFTKANNDNAIKFYIGLGFMVKPVTSIYKDGASVFSIPYVDLLRKLRESND
jgi:ribosomal protein S18 acetylase RimI-like enzyme